jgi:CBS domain-containing protein
MPDKVRDWMSSPAIVIHPDSAVSYTLTLMRRRHIHSVVVDLSTEGKPSYGIVTSTDIRDKIILGNRKPSETQVREMYREMVLVRRLEEAAAVLYQEGKIGGFLHLYIGQEAVAVGPIAATALPRTA